MEVKRRFEFDGMMEAAKVPRTVKDADIVSPRKFSGKNSSPIQLLGDNNGLGYSLPSESEAISSANLQQVEVTAPIWTRKDADIVSPRKVSGKISSSIQHGDKKDTAADTITQKKSLSGPFIVNIDEFINNGVGSLHEISSIHTRASSNGYSLPSDAISDNDTTMAESPPSNEQNPDSCNWRKIPIEPTLPIHLKFQDVEHKVAVKEAGQAVKEKCILQGITGSVRPGEVLALMAPSGGGKTTLLNLLSGRVKINKGVITYNGQPYNKSLKRRIGFVMQDDIVFPHLTVKETLTYAALLRLPKTLSRKQKIDRAMNVLRELGLESCKDTFVRGLSGGERKRVCIGNEILLNPSLLFLDEPTSGLDSSIALRIVQTLHNLAEAGKTVVTTIHQPSSRLFSKFDRLILLGNGSSLYFGKASEAMLHFSLIGCSPLIAMNPAEFLIDLANGNINDKSVPSELEDKLYPACTKGIQTNGSRPSPFDVHKYLVGAYVAKVAKMEKRKHPKPVVVEGAAETAAGRWNSGGGGGASWWEQFSILLRRGLKERRHEYFSFMRVTQVISTAFVLGFLWWHSDASSPKRLQDQAGLLFFISVFWGFFPLFTATFTFPQERAMLGKERSVDMYKLSAYFVARNTSDLPLDLLLPIPFLLIVYFMAGLKPSFAAFTQTMLTVFLCIVASQGLGLTIGAAFMDVKKATTLASVVVMAFMLSGGFFIQKVPSFMSWARYISFNYHTYRLLLKIQYSCPDSGSCESSIIRPLRLDQSGMEVGALAMMIIGYRLLAYFFLRRMKLRTTL